MKVCKSDSDEIVWHLPMEISRITNFIVNRGAKCTLKIRVIHYRRSLLVQGGLEVPCEVSITMIGSVVNHLLLTRYESLLKELYIEPKDEEIVSTLFHLPKMQMRSEKLWKQSQDHNSLNHNSRKRKEVNSRDIQDMFRNPTKKATNNKKVIVID